MSKFSTLTFFCLILSHPIFSQEIDHWETAVFANSTWQYHVGTSDPGANWNAQDFDDSGWLSGKGGFGYGDADDSTIVSPVTSVFIRNQFTISVPSDILQAALHIDYDDGFVAYLNGIEIARIGIEGSHPAYDQTAANHEAVMYQGQQPEYFLLSKASLDTIMTNGLNTMAIQIHNQSSTSSDLTLRPYLSFGIESSTKYFQETPEWFYVPQDGVPTVVILESSNMPIVKITTENNASIVDEPKIKAHMAIIDQGERNHIDDTPNIYDGVIGIEIRGNTSANYPQTPYSIETRDESGDNNNIPLWHMPAENDWSLLSHYNDKPFMRNALGLKIFSQMGYYSPRTKLCEVVLNEEYQGVYLFTEKIKRDDGRVNIAKLNPSDNSGDELTGGYIFKVDQADEGDFLWYSKPNSWHTDREVFFVFHDPDGDELTDQQKGYLEEYVHAYEAVLFGENFTDSVAGYHNWINVKSFIDYFIITEMGSNGDGYKKSKFYFKDKDSKGGLINSGPAWDFDWGWKFRTSANLIGSGWRYTQRVADNNPDRWIQRMVEDPVFANTLHERYYALRESFLHTDSIFAYIDSISNYADEAQERHYAKWKTLGINVGSPEIGEIPTTYEGEVQRLKDFVDIRFNWLDDEMNSFYNEGYGVYDLSPKVDVDTIADALTFAKVAYNTTIRVFPNPSSEFLNIQYDAPLVEVELINVSGQIVFSNKTDFSTTRRISISKYQPGIYFVKAKTNDGDTFLKRVIIR